ncbi:phosphodiester glycosidase family protein [Demequina lignilytica]|uniref:Phosphodiester glycosidase family protein n=1 Tax=Demequina lignilytica TaxID=3051663 RepID=A0AB35MJA9_9MICO|nr:phosphodiester glycosidase family protein [Demequina sp. SYSU T0a273]MDN4483896.1 phosphodiester glycosidase family protein [Demequina sp. SYSU T0a273]
MLRARSIVALAAAALLAGCSGATAPAASTATPTAASSGASASSTPTPTASDEPAAIVGTLSNPEVDGHRFAVLTLPLEEWDVRVDWPQEDDGTDLAVYLADHPEIAALTNAGIFSDDLRPGGLLVSDGEVLRDLNLADGGGNFHLKPNAVFAVHDDGTAEVVDSTAYDPAGVTYATQSGPALVLDGEIHPEFREGSVNTAVRSGVGVSPDGTTVHLALSLGFVNLWDFATLFRDVLGCDDALYLDGQISQLWITGAPEPTPYLGPYAGVIAVYPR